jgi:hypothetical protein
MPHRTLLVSALACGASLAPSPALAQRAAYAALDELPSEPIGLSLDVSLGGRYQRVLSAGRIGDVQNIGDLALRTRVLLGARVAYAAGLDASIGGAEAGVSYSASAFVAGVAVRYGDASAVALSGGVGASAVGAAVPIALMVPAELRWTQSAGPLRLALWMQWSWAFANELRRHGSSTLSFVDEAEVGLSVRAGRQQRYWRGYSGGAGPALGVSYRESMGARVLGFSLCFDLAGAR